MPLQTPNRSSEQLVNRLNFLNRVYAFVGPIAILVICTSAQILFTNYFTDLSQKQLLPILSVMFLVLAARLIVPKISKTRLAVEYGIVAVYLTIVVNFIFPFPSPYILAGAILAVLIYFEFGPRWAIASLVFQYGILLITATMRNLALEQYIDLIAYSVTPIALALYIVRLQTLAKQEIISIEDGYREASNSSQSLQSLINNISDGVIATDSNLKVIVYNAAALDVLDLNIDIRGKSLHKILSLVDNENQTVAVKQLLKQTEGPTTNRDLRITYNDGSTANLYLGISPIYLGYGKSDNNGYTLLLRDITREKSLEEERDEFISVVSHELRTPIAISEGNISNAEFIAEKTGDVTAIKAALKEAHNQILFLGAMINDLSTLSRAERGALEVTPEPINIHELGQELLKNYQPDATKKGLELKLELDPSLELLSSSKLYVREVLQNFITNAIKYTEKGSVTIGARPSVNGVSFSIRDTGIGISKGDQERVFDKFFRSEDFRTRQNNGTGLGLYVTLKLTKLLHATIDIDSELNKGSTFTIDFPNFK